MTTSLRRATNAYEAKLYREEQSELNQALVLLKDIYEHLDGGAPLYPGSLIFEEDRQAVDVIGNFLRSTGRLDARP